MIMFDEELNKKKLGPNLTRSDSLNHLAEVETYVNDAVKKLDMKLSYDVTAIEMPYFETFSYTEWAKFFLLVPLNAELRCQQMLDAYNDNSPIKYDYLAHFRDVLTSNNANKYNDRTAAAKEMKSAVVALPGSNRLKSGICLNRLRFIKKEHGDDVWFKPHPLTKYSLVGELQDLFGKNCVLDRDEDIYPYIEGASIVYSSHLSETAIYALALGKTIEPIDVYNDIHKGAFYHINKYLFHVKSPTTWINRVLNSPKSGLFNPLVDPDWKISVDNYLEYIMNVREPYKNQYIRLPKKTTVATVVNSSENVLTPDATEVNSANEVSSEVTVNTLNNIEPV